MIRVIDSDSRHTTLAVDEKGLQKIKQCGDSLGRAITTDIDVETQYIRIQHNKRELAFLERVISQHNIDIETPTKKHPGKKIRYVVPAKQYNVGDTINGNKITGLGNMWRVTDPDFYSVNNIHPSIDWVQYAYCDG